VKARECFKDLVTDVGMGRVGFIVGIEARRATTPDWNQLLDLCALTDTLIAYTDRSTTRRGFQRRRVLGSQGTMSEAGVYLIPIHG
jgi:hypothetical protein